MQRPRRSKTLWARDDLGAAFMCGFPFALAAPQPRRRSRRRSRRRRAMAGGRVYCTDFVVRADSRFRTLADTSGGRIGWTVEHSQSGYNAVRHHLLPHRRARSRAGSARW